MDVKDKPSEVEVSQSKHVAPYRLSGEQAAIDAAEGVELLGGGDFAMPISDAPKQESFSLAVLKSQGAVKLGMGLWLVIIGTLLMRVGGAAVGLMLQLFTADAAIAAAIVGVVSVSFYLSELVGAPYFGTQVDKHGWRPYILAGPILGGGAVLLTAVSGLFSAVWAIVALLFFSRLLGGLSVATNTPASLSYLSAAGSKDPQVRSRSVGYFELAVVAGTALGGLLGGLLWDAMKLWGFVALTVLYAITWAMLRAMPQEEAKPDVAAKHDKMGLLRSRTLWEFAPAWIAVNALYGVLANNAVRMLADKEGHFPDQLLVGLLKNGGTGLLFGIFAIILSAGILIWTRLLPLMRSSTAMIISLLGAGGTCAVLLAMNHAPAAAGVGYWSLTAGLVVSFLVISGFTPAALAVLVQIGEKNHTDRGAVMGAYSVLLGLGQFLGGAIGGFVATAAGFDGIIGAIIVFAVISFATMVHWRSVEHNY